LQESVEKSPFLTDVYIEIGKKVPIYLNLHSPRKELEKEKEELEKMRRGTKINFRQHLKLDKRKKELE